MTRDELEQHPEELLLALANHSFEFADLMRDIFPEFEIYPCQALDTPQVHPLARVVFRPGGLLPPSESEACVDVQQADVRADLYLFESPDPITHMRRCLELKATELAPPFRKMSLKKIVAALAEESVTISYMTVKRAFHYARLMESQGLSEPFKVLLE